MSNSGKPWVSVITLADTYLHRRHRDSVPVDAHDHHHLAGLINVIDHHRRQMRKQNSATAFVIHTQSIMPGLEGLTECEPEPFNVQQDTPMLRWRRNRVGEFPRTAVLLRI